MEEYVLYLEDPNACYDWWTIGVRQESDGSYTWAEGSGCSCNDYGHEDAQPLPETWEAFEKAVEGHPADAVTKAEALHNVKQLAGIFK